MSNVTDQQYYMGEFNILIEICVGSIAIVQY